MLLGAALPGVGPSTAEAIAKHFGSKIEGVMDGGAAIKQLSKVAGIGPKKAEKIKTAWDATRGVWPACFHQPFFWIAVLCNGGLDGGKGEGGGSWICTAAGRG